MVPKEEQSERIRAPRLEDCPECDGTGDCQSCNGEDENCDTCDGTWECLGCDGTGQIEED